MYSIEDVEECVDDYGLEDEEMDDLIAGLPFFENLVADSLTELFTQVDIVPWDDPLEHFDEFEREA
jgi:hypothetical protein